VAAAQEAEAKVEDLDNQLDQAREALADAQELVRRLGAELDDARRAARDAQKESREARKRYNRL
jgi:chromosome segregation ATPase